MATAVYTEERREKEGEGGRDIGERRGKDREERNGEGKMRSRRGGRKKGLQTRRGIGR